MAALQCRVQLGRAIRGRLFVTLALTNVVFAAATAAFILLWARMDSLSPAMQHFTRYILIQGHLATENVIAAWYSSMLLLAVSVMCVLAWAVDRKGPHALLHHGWLLSGAVFALLSFDEIGSLHERVGMLPVLSGQALGWVYVLGAPILAVGAFLLAFAWFHVRRVAATFALMAAGTVMFLMNPVLESIEMAMIHGAGATQGTWQRRLHDVLLVVEEGGLELFGILCFLAAVGLYVARQEEGLPVWLIEGRLARRVSRSITVALASGVFVSGWVVARLPRADSGIPENWFPAAAWMLVALTAFTCTDDDRLRARRFLAACAIGVSATAGAGLYSYVGWLASRASWVTPVATVIAGGLTLEVLLGSYFFRRSPRSSTASPTLRRPRPNPS